MMQRSPIVKYEVRVDGGLSKAHIARHSSPTPLFYVIISMVANHAPSMQILGQFPSGSMSVNLAFQSPDKTLKSPYICNYLLSKLAILSNIGNTYWIRCAHVHTNNWNRSHSKKGMLWGSPFSSPACPAPPLQVKP